MKLVTLTIEPEPGSDQQTTLIDVCLDNMSYAVENNGVVNVFFCGGEPLTINSGVWQQLKDMWLQPETNIETETE